MKKILLTAVITFAALSLSAQTFQYTDGHNSWQEDSLGNHRAVVHFSGKGQIARVIIPWRRADDSPHLKRIIVQDAKTGNKISNVKNQLISGEKGDIFFEPVSGAGTYYIYYLPSKNEGRANYPKGVYWAPEKTASGEWLSKLDSKFPFNTVVKEIQSIDAFNSFYPMEVAASDKEVNSLIAHSPRKDLLVFTEDRIYPIRMATKLPYRWIQRSPNASFNGKAAKGEQYSFQIGIYALQQLDQVNVSFSRFTNAAGQMLPAKNISCINTSGTDYKADQFLKTISVTPGQVQALWFLAAIPANAAAGKYSGKVTITALNKKPVTVPVSITVEHRLLADGGISEPWKQTRLHWLNSNVFQDNKVISPYIPLTIDNKTISLLGRKITLGTDGFPKQIQTFFTPEMTGYSNQPNELITKPVAFNFINNADGSALQLSGAGTQFTRKEEGMVEWTSTSAAKELEMEVHGALEFDGFISYKVKVTALTDLQLRDINMQIPFSKNASRYMMGLGQKGAERPENFQWKWDVQYKNQDGAWIGAVNAGLQYSLRDENYSRPLNTNFYLQKPLHLPTSWGNDNKGGITISEQEGTALVNNYSGERSLKKGDILFFNFTLLVTPFHTINTDFQWENRFFHRYKPIDTIRASGATVVNIHHANAINPWINYPFIEYPKMKSFIDSAHAAGLKVKIYNTVRELSNKAYETFPLRSLGHEIYSPGKAGGFSWLQEHIGKDYIAAWFVPELKDAAIVNSGMSRWHNYYVEGMNWLVQNVGIDGIYLDDVAFDRITMKRIKRALTKDGHPGIIDLHSANQFNKSDGFNNSGNLYLEHFPYLNRLWFGEYFDYENNSPDFFLTEVSGIPFGLMGEMLEGGGNPWRGMIYGMTNRYPWSDNADPRNLWKEWDAFGMKGTDMIGYWSENCPVKTSDPKVLATVYKKPGAAMISIASWAAADTNVKLLIDWKKLGIDPDKAILSVPYIKNFQPAKTIGRKDLLPVEKSKGCIIIIKEK